MRSLILRTAFPDSRPAVENWIKKDGFKALTSPLSGKSGFLDNHHSVSSIQQAALLVKEEQSAIEDEADYDEDYLSWERDLRGDSYLQGLREQLREGEIDEAEYDELADEYYQGGDIFADDELYGIDADRETQGQKKNAQGGVKMFAAYDPETATIREQIINSQDLLNNMEVVARASVPTNLNKRNAEKWAVETLKASGYQVDRHGFGTILLNKKDIHNGVEHANTPADLAAIAVVDKVLKRGIEIGGHDNHKGRKKKTVTFAGPVELNGQRGNMGVVVNLNGDHYYSHKILLPDGRTFVFRENEKEAAQEPHQGVTTKGSLAGATRTASRMSIAERKNKVKTKSFSETEAEYEAAIEKGDMEAAQRMVDQAAKKNGYIPAVRYHQTDKKFTEFRTDQPKAGRNDSETPNGIFFKTDDRNIGLDGDIQMEAYLKTENTLYFGGRKAANAWYQENIDGYRALQEEMQGVIAPITEEMDALEDQMFGDISQEL